MSFEILPDKKNSFLLNSSYAVWQGTFFLIVLCLASWLFWISLQVENNCSEYGDCLIISKICFMVFSGIPVMYFAIQNEPHGFWWSLCRSFIEQYCLFFTKKSNVDLQTYYFSQLWASSCGIQMKVKTFIFTMVNWLFISL